MPTRYIAIIDQTNTIPAGKLAQAAAAIQKQVLDDFGPIWDVSATVDDFPSLTDKPLEYWPVVIRKKLGTDGAGVHVSHDGDRAFALVRLTPNSDDWIVTLSHEILEMLADPLGTETVSGPSPLGDGRTVKYLREVCDPCQGPAREMDPNFEFQYLVNGVYVSDFVVPAYYKSFGPGRYSFAGRITQPRELLTGGYYTWQDAVTLEWSYTFFDGTQATTTSLGQELSTPDVHLRGLIDRRVAAATKAATGKRRARRPGTTAPDRAAGYAEARAAQATWWQREIDRAGGEDTSVQR